MPRLRGSTLLFGARIWEKRDQLKRTSRILLAAILKIQLPPANCTRVGTMLLNPSALDRKSTRLNSSHTVISYAVFCLKKKKKKEKQHHRNKKNSNIKKGKKIKTIENKHSDDIVLNSIKHRRNNNITKQKTIIRRA